MPRFIKALIAALFTVTILYIEKAVFNTILLATPSNEEFLLLVGVITFSAAVAGWHTSRRRGWIALPLVIMMVTTAVWLPWMASFMIGPSPLGGAMPMKAPSEEEIREIVAKGALELCGLYRASEGVSVFRYSGSATSTNNVKCLFIILRPEPRHFYNIWYNATLEVHVEGGPYRWGGGSSTREVGLVQLVVNPHFWDRVAYGGFNTGYPKTERIAFEAVKVRYDDVTLPLVFFPDPGATVSFNITFTVVVKKGV